MASVRLEQVRKVYPDGTEAVRGVSLDIGEGELLVLVGPSGCGKSTLLRIIAGLEPATEGTVRIGDRVVTDLPAAERDVAMVFQSYALYPHMTVFDNIAFGLAMRRVPRGEIRHRVDKVAATLGLAGLLGKKPRELSGGQRQRVALGRAIVREPRVFLLDEPLSNLDATLRVQMRVEIARLQRQAGVTTVYVTHDQSEALTLGDRVAVLARGVVQQVAPPQALYEEPANLLVAEFIGSPGMNLLRARLGTAERPEVQIGPHRLGLPESLFRDRPALAPYCGREVVMGIRPEHLAEADATTDPARRLPVQADVIEHLGAEILAHCAVEARAARTDDRAAKRPDSDSTVITARLGPHSDAREGRPLTLVVDTSKLHFFDPQSGLRAG